MAFTTPAMGLIVWNQPSDPYDSTQLAGNFAKIDEHDHTAGKGQPITTAAIADGAITSAKLDTALTVPAGSVGSTQIAPGAVTTTQLGNGAVTADKLADAALLGLTDSSSARRGKSIIATSEARTNAAFGLMTTPDQVSNIVLASGGLIFVAYQALWKESVVNTARASIFLNSAQASQQSVSGPGPVSQSAQTNAASDPGFFVPLTSFFGGLYSGNDQGIGSNCTSDVTTGQLIGQTGGGSTTEHGGLAVLFADPGTYNISVQFRATSGTVTVKERKLWVWTVGF